MIAERSAAGRPVNAELVELHRKFSLPFACLVFGLVGVPLGIQPVRAVRSRSFSVSLVLIFGYYLLLTAGEAMAERGTLPAVVALWIPNVVFAVLGLSLFVAVARERSLDFGLIDQALWRAFVARPRERQPVNVLLRYVLSEFLRIFALCMLGFLLIYVLVDLFDHLDGFLRYQATAGEVARYLLFKIPLIVTQLVPVATLASVLLALGTMARHNELTALRASGISTVQIALPLFVTALVLSLGILAWNEAVVPYATERSRYVEIVEIRNKPLKALLSEHGIWFHGRSGIYNIEHSTPEPAR